MNRPQWSPQNPAPNSAPNPASNRSAIQRLLDPGPRGVALGLLLLRLAVGSVFVAHGLQKLVQYTLPGTVAAFGQMGVPLPALSAPLVAGLETVGGLLLLLGLFTRVAAPLLAANMLGALLLVHLPAGLFLPNGYEFVLTLAAASLALTLAGPGAAALDGWLARRSAARAPFAPSAGGRVSRA